MSSPPKRLDPALWQAARDDWEADVDLSYSAIAKRLGVSLPSVTLRARRELWVKGRAVSLQRIDFTPTQMIETAVRALMHAASQTKDVPSAIKAADLLLCRVMGRVPSAEAQPMLNTVDLAEFPAWLEARRLAYQEGVQTPEPALPPAESAPSSPEPRQTPSRPILHSVPAPAPSQFWDSPTKPAR
jgi:hypothetical protein